MVYSRREGAFHCLALWNWSVLLGRSVPNGWQKERREVSDRTRSERVIHLLDPWKCRGGEGYLFQVA